jgi:sarcosine oxidase
VELTGLAGRLWDRLSAEASEQLLVRTGGLDHGRLREPERLAGLLKKHGVAAELLHPGEAASRRPGAVFDGPTVFDPESGVLDPERSMAAMARLAAEAGAYLSYKNPVHTLHVEGEAVRISTARGEWRARTVVVAAGAWIAPLLAGIVELPPLSVTQQQAFFFRPYDPGTRWPTIIHANKLDIYGTPEGQLFKLGEHSGAGKPTTADDRDFIVDPAARDRMIRYVARYLPGLDPLPVRELTCLYTSTPSEDFIIDRQGPIVVCSPCSGHGAKFAPLVGELAADLVDGHAPANHRFTLAAHRRP